MPEIKHAAGKIKNLHWHSRMFPGPAALADLLPVRAADDLFSISLVPAED
jgi:hypothetical protein